MKILPYLTEEQIIEIVDQLDFGFRSYWNRKTGELLFVPDFNSNPFVDTEMFEEEFEKLENDYRNYIEIEKPTSSDNFEIMADFTEKLSDNVKLKNQLINALNRKKPFREFKDVIDNSGKYRQQWFDFKQTQLLQWVRDKFDEATEGDSEDEEE